MKHPTPLAPGLLPGKALIVLFICLLCYKDSNGQINLQSYTVHQLDQDGGLSQGSNYFVHEDSRGFMWLTAIDAINRYDGSTVKVYNLKRNFKQCPPLQQGYGFAEDKSGKIYVGSTNGLYIYHPDLDKFTLRHVFRGPDKLTMPFACIDGYIWCFNKDYQLATYCVANGQVSVQDSLPLPAIGSVHIYNTFQKNLYDRWPFADKNGKIWVPGEQGLYCYDPKTRKKQYIGCPSLQCCYYNRELDAIMIGAKSRLLYYDIAANTINTELDCSSKQVQLINSICFNKGLVVCNTEKGLLARDRLTKQTVWLKHRSSKVNTSYALRIDKAGRIWVCDDGLGMAIYDFTPPLLPKVSSDQYSSSLTQTRGVTHFSELPDGSILTYRNLLFDPKTKTLKQLKLPAMDHNNFLISETDKNGAWMIFYLKRQLNIWLIGKQGLQKIFAGDGADTPGICHSFKTFEDGTMLLSFSKGLYLLKKNRLTRIPEQPDASPFVVNRLHNNRLAVSYLNGNMWLVERRGGHLQFLKQILPGVQSFYIVEDSTRNRYWVATNQGVYLLNKNLNPQSVFDANTGLAGTYMYGILLDDEGNAWCSHQRGISSIDAKTLAIVNYDKSDGIQDWDYNNRAFYKATDGTLYFGGTRGFNYFKPPINLTTAYKPTVYIDEILVNNNTWKPDTSADLQQQLLLSHMQNNIVVKAAVKDLMHGAARRLIYRLRETDSSWKELPSNGAISLNSMAPGRYTLELGIIDKYKKLPVVQKRILISITAPFYLKSWFMVLLGIGFSFVVLQVFLLIKRNRRRNLQRHQQALEQQRNKITADLHDDIGASLSCLQINSIVASQLIDKEPTQARKVLEQIAVQSKDLSVRMSDIIWSMKPPGDAFISLNTRIGNFVSEMMSNTEISYKIDIDEDADKRIAGMAMRRNILLIVKEAVNNIAKHSAASELLVCLNLERRKAILRIRDNGKGFNAGSIVPGNGLSNLKQRALEINAGIEIHSTVNMGTSITVEIPLTQLHHKTPHI